MRPRHFSDIEQQFRANFSSPCRWPHGLITSPQLDELQIDFELATDEIAGPMQSYYERGNIDYVFAGRHEGFKALNLKTRADVIRWCRETMDGFRAQVKAVPVTSPVEANEQQLILAHLAEIDALIGLFDQCLREQYPT